MAPQASTINCLILAHQRHFLDKKKIQLYGERVEENRQDREK
jgi:hypothetical protein